jgi:recombination protein RecA
VVEKEANAILWKFCFDSRVDLRDSRRRKGEYVNPMASATAVRFQIESALENRFPSALTPQARTIRETVPTGIDAVDALLEGGLPVGAISEITGAVSSGRTSLALRFLSRQTKDERVCAWVDAHDALDAESAAASGVKLRQLLWVRCRPFPTLKARAHPDFTRMDQALRATDLLLQTAGFSAIVLDLGSVAPEHGARIPLATWFRFRQAADRTRCSLLVVAEEPLAQSSAAVVLECGMKANSDAGGTVLRSCTYEVRTGRQRFTPFLAGKKKPPASTWQATSKSER